MMDQRFYRWTRLFFGILALLILTSIALILFDAPRTRPLWQDLLVPLAVLGVIASALVQDKPAAASAAQHRWSSGLNLLSISLSVVALYLLTSAR